PRQGGLVAGGPPCSRGRQDTPPSAVRLSAINRPDPVTLRPCLTTGLPFLKRRSSLDPNPSAVEMPRTRCGVGGSLNTRKTRDWECRACMTSRDRTTDACHVELHGAGERSGG